MADWPQHLLAWYQTACREMPWRGHPDAYAVWVSEIMLQQTQVNTVRPYFERFLKTFPDIRTLAAAPDETLLKAWEGLGYYTRVRNLRKAAQVLVQTNGAQLPTTAQALKALPGIGPYTAAAIASICFNEPEPVVDGNVARVFARHNLLTDDFTKEPNRRKLADWLRPFICKVPIPGDFNQAMMELGALVCTPKIRNAKSVPCAQPARQKKRAHRKTTPSFPHEKFSPNANERFTSCAMMLVPSSSCGMKANASWMDSGNCRAKKRSPSASPPHAPASPIDRPSRTSSRPYTSCGQTL